MKISEISPYRKNAKKHDKKQIAQIAASIKAFGFNQPIVVDKDNVIIVGHGRYEAAKVLGLEEVPVMQVALNKEQASAYRLADNKLNESEWDMSMVIEELKELSMEMLELTGFEKDLIVEEDDKDDIVPVDAPAIAKLGDVWQLGDHRIICGDSTDPTTYRKLVTGMADLVFTDPPYNVGYKGRGKKTSVEIMNDDMDVELFRDFLTKTFQCIHDSIKRGGGLYVFHSSSSQAIFEDAMTKTGFVIKNQLIWNKPVASMGWGDYRWKHEPFFYACLKDLSPKFYGDRTHSTVVDFQKDEASLIA